VTGSSPFLILAIRGHISFLKSMSNSNKFISVLNQMSMKLHSKLGIFLRVKTMVLKRLHAAKAVNGATNSQNDSVEADIGGSLAEMLTKSAVLLQGVLELAPRPGIFTVPEFHEMNVPLIGCELTRDQTLDKGWVGWCGC